MLPGFLDELWVKDIHPSRSPLRNGATPMNGLVFSIEEKGVLQPIVVRPIEEGFEVVAGNRRLEACRKLRLRKVPCYIVGLDDKQAYEVSLTENLQRRSLNPIEEAKAFKRYVDEGGYGAVSELASRIAKSEPYVSKRLALLDLPKELQEELIRRRISPSIAEEFISLDPHEIGEVTRQLVLDQTTRTEVRSTIRMVREKSAKNADPKQYQEQSESLRIIERARSKSIASMSACLMQLDDAIQSLGEDEWFVRENLVAFRMSIHQSIDKIARLQKMKSQTEELVNQNLLDQAYRKRLASKSAEGDRV